MILILVGSFGCSSKIETMMDLAAESPNKEICGNFFLKEDPALSHHIGTYCIIFKESR